MTQFRNRREAGRALAERLRGRAGGPQTVVLGLPRGGLPVAAEVAEALGSPLDVLVVRKLGVPGHEELAMGAVASGGGRVVNEDIVRELRLTQETVERVSEREREELERRERAFRGEQPLVPLKNRTVVLVDDGVATGATMRSAVAAVRSFAPARVLVATPVAPQEAVARLREEADEVVCLATPEPFVAVGRWYSDFPQTGDDEVRAILRAHRPAPAEEP